jgi:cellulose synthase/poly-beta-1,6-N-acetylglucosamine synthase-like glycosyltransferase
MQYISRIFTYTVYIISMYYLCMSFFGIVRIRDKGKFKPQKRFALIVAAHNEELVIANIIESLKKLNYPKELFNIFVIADNCNDKTAAIARENGANVFERTNKEKKGKGYALEWMFNKIFKMQTKYDAVAIFDADNLVHKDFLIEMNKQLCKGYKVVQGYLDSKNPEDTWITGSYSIAFWTTNRMFQLSRNNLGLSTQLGGTGCCIDVNILKELGWGATCLTEDLEFTCKLVLNGYKVGWAHDAIIYDEKPLTMTQSWWQRKRWMQGFADVSSRYFFKLMKRAITKLDFTAFDCALYSINPIAAILFGISAILSIINYSLKTVKFMAHFSAYVSTMSFSMGMIFIIIAAILQYIYTPFILILEKKLNLKVFWYYILYPFYSLTWLPISLLGIIHKNDKEWNHTQHTRSVNIDELEKVN